MPQLGEPKPVSTRTSGRTCQPCRPASDSATQAPLDAMCWPSHGGRAASPALTADNQCVWASKRAWLCPGPLSPPCSEAPDSATKPPLSLSSAPTLPSPLPPIRSPGVPLSTSAPAPLGLRTPQRAGPSACVPLSVRGPGSSWGEGAVVRRERDGGRRRPALTQSPSPAGSRRHGHEHLRSQVPAAGGRGPHVGDLGPAGGRQPHHPGSAPPTHRARPADLPDGDKNLRAAPLPRLLPTPPPAPPLACQSFPKPLMTASRTSQPRF